MKSRIKRHTAVALVAAVVALGCTKQAATPVEGTVNSTNAHAALNDGILKVAKEFATLLGNERFETATNMFEPALARTMDAKKLETAWSASAKQRGAFRKVREVREQPGARNAAVFVTCEFEKAIMNLEIRFGSTGQVQTFYLHRGS